MGNIFQLWPLIEKILTVAATILVTSGAIVAGIEAIKTKWHSWAEPVLCAIFHKLSFPIPNIVLDSGAAVVSLSVALAEGEKAALLPWQTAILCVLAIGWTEFSYLQIVKPLMLKMEQKQVEAKAAIAVANGTCEVEK